MLSHYFSPILIIDLGYITPNIRIGGPQKDGEDTPPIFLRHLVQKATL